MAAREPLLLYNLFPLLAGTFAQWEGHFPRLAALGCNAIYLNPLHLPGFSGSLYAVKDYYQFHPLLVDGLADPVAQLKKTFAAAHRHGLKIILDLVINHTAIDSPLVNQHPHWYKRRPDGKILNPGALDGGKWVTWGDLAELNYADAKARTEMLAFWQKLVAWLLELGADGFRCDAAYQVPAELWAELIAAARVKNRETLFLAETLGCTIDQSIALAQAGFDCTFNSSKYWNYRDPWLFEQLHEYLVFVPETPSIAFAESHDTNRLYAELNGNDTAIRQRLQFTALWSSGFMLPMGMEFGFRQRLNVVSTRPADSEQTGIDLSPFLRELFALKRQYAVLHEDNFAAPVALQGSGDVLALRKVSRDRRQQALLLINRDLVRHQRVYLHDISAPFQRRGPVRDISLEHRLPAIEGRFEYHLLPGQIKILLQEV